MFEGFFSVLEGHQVVKTNLNIDRLRLLLRSLFSILVVSTIVFAFLYATTAPDSGTHNLYQVLSLGYQASFLLIAPFLLLYGFSIFMSIPFLKEHEQRRQAAAYGDQRFLATEQLLPDEQAILLPITVRARPDWHLLIAYLIVMIPCAGIIVLVWVHFRPDKLFDMLLFIMAGLFVFCFYVFLFIKLFLQNSTRLVATEKGLTILRPGSTPCHLDWSDIRLVAIDIHVFVFNKNQTTIFFEVSGIQEIIRWSWKLSDRSHSSLINKKFSSYDEEYDLQMKLLISIIAYKTKLPLYDLRKL